jgi:hypothetical protein
MRRVPRILLALLLLAACWWAMMAMHELGHVVGAYVTGGTVTNVVLHPLAISRTDVSPNPHPGLVVWSGPLAGAGIPLACAALLPKRCATLRNIALFFGGFCLIANGAYIAAGAWDLVGDCREMVQTGTPRWLMIVFGAVTIPLGLYLWHRLGSVWSFFQGRSPVNSESAAGLRP